MKHPSSILYYVFGLFFILILIAEAVAISNINSTSVKDINDAKNGICLEIKHMAFKTAPQ